jgi:hypothetical protein
MEARMCFEFYHGLADIGILSRARDNVAHNLCCQIRADDNSSTCTFTTGKSVTCTGACANEIFSCNLYICCTNMLYEYIFALFVLDK